MARKRANLTDLLNDLTFKVIYEKFKLICINEFEWKNLPNGILERHIERWLFENGKAVFFNDPGHGLMCLEVLDGGKVNPYGDPIGYRAFGIGFQRFLDAEECVVIENNKLRIPTKQFVMFYTNKLTEAERTMDVNVKANKTPVIVLCDDKDVLSFKRIFQQVDGNVPAIFADRAMNIDGVSALDLKAQFLCNDLMDYKRSVESELLTFLGINNSAVDKKERLITDEANANNELIESFFDLQLEARERACEEINAMFGTNISVARRQKPVENSVDTVERGGSDADE